MIKNNSKTWSDFVSKTLDSYLKKSGLETNVDLIEMNKKINFNSKGSILEVGPGGGRVLDYFFKIGFKGKLSAVEISKNILEELKEKYKEKVSLYNKDVSKNFDFDEKFDIILWVWSSFVELSKEEQIKFLKNSKEVLKSKGCLIIDLPKTEGQSNIENKEGELGYTDTVHGRVYMKLIDEENMKNLAKRIFSKIEVLTYKTTTGRERITYYLYK